MILAFVCWAINCAIASTASILVVPSLSENARPVSPGKGLKWFQVKQNVFATHQMLQPTPIKIYQFSLFQVAKPLLHVS